MASPGAVRAALLHLHQRSAPLDAREALALAAERVAPAPDLIALSTCHRIEVYAAVPLGVDPRAHFAARLGEDGAALVPRAGLGVDAEVPRHLFRLACGLDSAVRGEGQILNQLRRTYDAARASVRLHSLLADLFQHALHLGRELRGTTPLGGVRRSIGSLAVDEGLRSFAEPTAVTALVVGAGEIGKLAARALRRRVGYLLVMNRDLARAERVALEADAEALPLDAIDAALTRADLVISAADTRGTLLTAERLAPRLARGRLVLVDIAVPRSVEPEARGLGGLVYRTVDDLAEETDPAIVEALAIAERRCDEEAAAFVRRRRERLAAPTIQALRERAEGVRRARLERALAKLSRLGERDRGVVEALAASLTNALLHEPTVALRERPERADEVAWLFGLSRASTRSGRGTKGDGV